MEVRQLQYFRAVAELEHVTQAAERLHVAQSAISRQIRLLEEELGAPLFYREGTGIRLSAFGKRFLPRALRILREIEFARQDAEHFLNPDTGTVRLGFPHSVGVHYVPSLIAAFRSEAPNVQFDLVQTRVHNLLEDLLNGDLELAIITPWEDIDDVPPLTGEYLYQEEMRAIVPSNHPLAKKPDIHLSELQPDPFILFKPGYTLRTLVWDACLAAGFEPNIAFEAEETDTIRAFVQAGLGVSVLPMVHPNAGNVPGIAAVPIRGGGFLRSVGIAWHREAGQSGPARRFAQFVVARARAHGSLSP
ncbi:HTH-type transcriptional regulator GltC [Alicyclobacillus contaminans]|uniref:LysR family transcriptional regulator n=1 Tax=Alicyclobacillus contaminans TaxID=392016 RepID=UPI00041A19C5|nr:LysR family transcriptional regulator [Alicyclobacillus contaminans]GMA50596.1 HTH-type transcriptional regulator GltC [Alicyclobacillus contaminans]